MAEQYVSSRNLKFILHEVLKAPQTLSALDYYQDYNEETFNMALDAAKSLSDTHIFPFLSEMDKKVPVLENGEVKVHPQLKTIIEQIAEGGWIGAHTSYEEGGQQMPHCLLSAGTFIFYAANVVSTYCFLTQGAANLIRSFGSSELKDYYIPKMHSGDWQGTMALTEPQAGSSLSDLITSAELTDEGYYKIKGQKIYISGGDHNAVDNVVHLLLARIKGAPAGTKGISLFVVPKYRNENGEMVFNDVTTAGLFDKMGSKGYVAAQLMLGESDDCRGWLVGQPNKGLSYMFQMMNEARIATGLLAAGNASAAYYASLKYARERSQGRHPSNKDLTTPPVLIIEHADVRRMLLFQKAIVEGSIALLLQCSLYSDLQHHGEGEEKDKAAILLELLTPIVKTYPSEMGIQSTSAGMQCLGGAGYCKDFPLEQLYRDIRINAIYEGTTGIQGMDLLGRKIIMNGGEGAKVFFKEILSVTQRQTSELLKSYATKLEQTLQKLQEVTMYLGGVAMQDKPEVFLADATLYLEYFGIVTIAWQWLKQGEVAEKALVNAQGDEALFYQGKLKALQYFFEYELPKTRGLHTRLMNNDKLTVDLDDSCLV